MKVTIPDNFTQEDIQMVESLIKKIIRNKEKPKTISERFNLFPIQDHIAWHYYELQRRHLWPANEVNFEEDALQFNDPQAFPPRWRQLFKEIIGFFAPADGAVISNLSSFVMDMDTLEEQFYYLIQMYIEGQHAEGYNMCVKEFFPNQEEFKEVMTMGQNCPFHTKKIEFMEKYGSFDMPRVIKYVASACMEGVFFMGLFCIILFFVKEHKLPKFMKLNTQIRKDENIHRDFFCAKAKQIKDEFTPELKEQAIQIIKEATEIEVEFVEYLLREPVIDEKTDEIMHLTKKDIGDFIKLMADGILIDIGFEKFYNVETQINWMDTGSEKTNKYEFEDGTTTYHHTSATSRKGRRREVKDF